MGDLYYVPLPWYMIAAIVLLLHFVPSVSIKSIYGIIFLKKSQVIKPEGPPATICRHLIPRVISADIKCLLSL